MIKIITPNSDRIFGSTLVANNCNTNLQNYPEPPPRLIDISQTTDGNHLESLDHALAIWHNIGILFIPQILQVHALNLRMKTLNIT
jgi:hypothetical protein